MRSRLSLIALFLLLGVVTCPLASTGVFAACHADETAMDCCLPHEGSGAGGVAVKAPLATPATLADLGALDAIAAPVPATGRGAAFVPLERSGPRLHSRISVFLI